MLIETKIAVGIVLVLATGVTVATIFLLFMSKTKKKTNENIDEMVEKVELSKLEPEAELMVEEKRKLSPGEQRRVNRNKRRS